jgi:hypothetical protein
MRREVSNKGLHYWLDRAAKGIPSEAAGPGGRAMFRDLGRISADYLARIIDQRPKKHSASTDRNVRGPRTKKRGRQPLDEENNRTVAQKALKYGEEWTRRADDVFRDATI